MPDVVKWPPDSIQLNGEHVFVIAQQIQQHAGHEVCGLIIGHGTQATKLIPISNVSLEPERNFKMKDSELFHALKSTDNGPEEIIATYHTHPIGELNPSQEDIIALGTHWPNVIHLIATLKHQELRMKAWHFAENAVTSIPVVVNNTSIEIPIQERLSRAQKVAIILATILSVVLVVIIAISLLPPPPEPTIPLR